MPKDSQVNIHHAGTSAYREMLERIIKDGVCPFCKDFCEGKSPIYHPNPILIDRKYWAVTENVRPYEGALLHLLLVAKMHVLYPWQIPQEAWEELQEVLGELANRYSLASGTLFMRFGDTEFTGASVTHFHAQLIVGVSRKAGTDLILAPCGYQVLK